MDDTVRTFEVQIDGEPFNAPLLADAQSVMHAAAVGLKHFHKRELRRDSVIRVLSLPDKAETGSATIEQVLRWVKTDAGQKAFEDEPLGWRDELLDFAKRMGI